MSDLTQQEITRAATNDPSLATLSVTLGDRTFPVLDLEYDDYMLFLAKMQPLLQALGAKLGGKIGLGAGTGMTLDNIISYCGSALPEMAQIVCRQSDPAITVADVKKLGRKPTVLASAVLKQIEQNNIIKDIGDFFVQVLPLLSLNR